MASYELLDAVNTKDVRTTADVARVLGISEKEAGRQLRQAKTDGLLLFWRKEQRFVGAR